MKILIERPPRWLWDEAHKLFELDDKRVIYSWGETIYNPGNVYVDKHLIAHESTHTRQQQEIGGPEVWWKEYFKNKTYRADCELEAYRNQYRSFCYERKDPNIRDKYLKQIVEILTSDMYDIGMKRAEVLRFMKK